MKMDIGDNIKVTVAILAHNQISYIRQAILSVLEQETEYNFEILIHDDCSDDGTREVICEYEKKYPEKVVAVYEDENQYKKGNDYLQLAIWKHVRGEYYIALDGDDYWCDKHKIQRQVKFLEEHPECIAHTHLTKRINERNGKITYSPVKFQRKNVWDVEEIIDWADVFQTSALMYRSNIQKSIPRNFISFSAQDYPVALWLSINGIIAYSDWVMTVHRVNAMGSYTSECFGDGEKHKTLQAARKGLDERTELLERFDTLSGGKYKNIINYSTDRREFDILWNEQNYSKAKKNEYFKSLPIKKKCYYLCLEYCPVIVKLKNYLFGA